MYTSRLNPYSKPFEPSSMRTSKKISSNQTLLVPSCPPPKPVLHDGDQGQDDLGLRGLARVLNNSRSTLPQRFRLSPLDLPLDDFFGTKGNNRGNKLGVRVESCLQEHRAMASLISPYPVPEEYRVFSGRRNLTLPPMHPRLEEMGADALFFLFYAAPGDLLQVAAAYALHRQRWCYHKVWKLWVRRPARSFTVFATELMEKGLFEVFDVSKWQCVIGNFLLRYDDIAPLPHCPSDIFDFYQQSQRSDLYALPDANQLKKWRINQSM